ncbi:MAG: DNA polymerase III subunit gamma and tau, partial [Microbacterium sp.]
APRPPAPPAGPRQRPDAAPGQGSVTEWAVTPIPTGDGPAVAQLAVDDEPEEAASAPAHTLVLEREGEVLTGSESLATSDDDEAEEFVPPVDAAAPVPPRNPVVTERVVRNASGAQRYGEAVVRQVLGATFVREEPYTSPTRFG